MILIVFLLAPTACFAAGQPTNSRTQEAALAYQASPFSQLSMDYFARLSRDPQAAPSEKEMAIGKTWRILLPNEANPLTELMAVHYKTHERPPGSWDLL